MAATPAGGWLNFDEPRGGGAVDVTLGRSATGPHLKPQFGHNKVESTPVSNEPHGQIFRRVRVEFEAAQDGECPLSSEPEKMACRCSAGKSQPAQQIANPTANRG